MVQYVFTPWRDRYELLLVREQLYPSLDGASNSNSNTNSNTNIQDSEQKQGDGAQLADGELGRRCHDLDDEETRRRQHQAVARVSMWMQRGNCPHMVESTALLMSAMLSDREATAGENAASSAYAIRAAYAAAFSRFVTGLLDGHQDKQRKQSMYSVAKTIGLPATFVELRHQSTHEQLPSLAKLRKAAKKAMLWIWDYYWRHLGDDAGDPCRDAVLRYLREGDEGKLQGMVGELDRWPRERVLKTVEDVGGSLPGNQVFLKCAELSQRLSDLGSEKETEATDTAMKDTESREPAARDRGQEDFGWSQYEGSWKPKPIGIV
ncbi:hypothetical protein ACJ41O_013573 [Fusarium nematophilum]